MEEKKFIFGYIKNYFNKAIDYLKENDIIYLYGEPRIGKTYLADLCMGKVSEREYYKLHLKVYDGYNPSYYAFSLGLMNSDALYEVGKEIVTDIINDSELKSLKVIGKMIEQGRTYKQKIFSYLNDSEISIINRINFHCKNRSLYLIADDYEKWDDASKKLLSFFLTFDAKQAIPFLKKCKIIIIGESEKSINNIKEQIGNIPSINVKGYSSNTPFVEEFLKIHSGNNDLAESLYQITNGNLGMAYDLGYYMEENILTEDIQSSETKAQRVFLSIIDKRIKRINGALPRFATTIKAASIQGTIFDQKFLPEIVDENEFAIERMLSKAQQEHILKLITEKEDLYSFINQYIYQYFDENYNEYRKEFHYKFACAAKKINPSDYYTQYLHLRAASKNFEAAENLVIYMTCQKFKNNIVDNTLRDYLEKFSEDLYNNYLIISKSIDSYNQGLHREALAQLALITPTSELILLEKDYLTAYFIYDGWVYEKSNEASEILIYNFKNLLDTNFDMWLRSSLLLYIFYVNRLKNDADARNVEKKIMKEIAKRYQYDTSLEVIVQILNRNAGALYSTEIALQKNQKSVDYFEKYVHTLPLEYIYALTNYSGLLLVASEFDQGYIYAQKAINLISTKNIWIKDLSKIINNFVINGVLSNKINYEEAIKIFETLLKNQSSHKSILMTNNYYVLMALSGKTKEIIEKFEALFWSDAVQQHNDYYIYLIGINYICVAIAIDDLSVAQNIYNELNEMVPAICISEEYIIKKRYSIYNEIISNKQIKNKSFQFIENYFAESLKEFDIDYLKKPYILTDQQFWSVM
ncbi:MAG: ATP-binding protein [Clostridia bacterium]|nr:ATP-binding protein [Clostridia bacterium]